MIDIIVITKNNPRELMDTIMSIKTQIDFINRVIIVDDSYESHLEEILSIICCDEKVVYIYQKAKSIYNAFNIAMPHIRKNYLFLNSGDTLISGSFQYICEPATLPVISLRNNFAMKVLKKNNFFFWFCHQSIIFDKNFKQYFNEDYKIAADLDFYIRYVKEFGIPKAQNVRNGLIGYDLGGISSKNRILRDKEYLLIYYKNKLYPQFVLFLCLMVLKLFLGRYV